MNKTKHLGTIVWCIIVVGIIVGLGTFLGLRIGKNTTYTPDSPVQQEQENNGYAVEQGPELILEPEPIVEPEPIIEQKPVIPITPVVEIPKPIIPITPVVEPEPTKPIIVEPELDGTRLDAKNYLDSLESIALGTGSLDKTSKTVYTKISETDSGYWRTKNYKILIKGEYTQSSEDIYFQTIKNARKDLYISITVPTVLPYKVTRALDDYYRNDWESINSVKKKFEKLHTDFGFTHLKTSEMETHFRVSWLENGERVFHNTRNAIVNNFYIPWENKATSTKITTFFWKENIEIDPSIVSVSFYDYDENGDIYFRIDDENSVKIWGSSYRPKIKIDLLKLENPDDERAEFWIEWKSDESTDLNLIKSPSV